MMAENFWRGKSVLVTGARGFVGSWLSYALLERGAHVTVIVRDQPGISNFELLGLDSRAGMVAGSVSEYPIVERTLNEYDVDTCFHLAAQAMVGVANRSPLSTFESNIKGAWTVLEACRMSKLVERVVIASSDKAYGSQPRLPYTEDMPLLGRNPYDASKACADLLASSYHHTYDLPLAVARCANIYGGGDLNFSRLIPSAIQSALLHEAPVIRSDGTPVRDYLHVDDAVAAYLTLAEQVERPDVCGKAFNFGTSAPVSVLEVVSVILDACGAPDLEPDVRGAGEIKDEIERQYLDSQRAIKTLGWTATVSLGEGIRRAVEWYADLAQSQRLTAPELAGVQQ